MKSRTQERRRKLGWLLNGLLVFKSGARLSHKKACSRWRGPVPTVGSSWQRRHRSRAASSSVLRNEKRKTSHDYVIFNSTMQSLQAKKRQQKKSGQLNNKNDGLKQTKKKIRVLGRAFSRFFATVSLGSAQHWINRGIRGLYSGFGLKKHSPSRTEFVQQSKSLPKLRSISGNPVLRLQGRRGTTDTVPACQKRTISPKEVTGTVLPKKLGGSISPKKLDVTVKPFHQKS